ncbi:MAG: signal peptidase II [Acidaminococcaceae bacterium]
MSLTLISLVVVVLDQITKYFVTTQMFEGMSIPVWQNVFHFTFVLNPGAAFGLLEHSRWFFVAMASAVLLVVFYWRAVIQAEPRPLQVGIALFAGGALGNLIDRIHTGLVIDFFDFRIWPVFNIADIAICVGVGLILWTTIKTECCKTNQ